MADTANTTNLSRRAVFKAAPAIAAASAVSVPAVVAPVAEAAVPETFMSAAFKEYVRVDRAIDAADDLSDEWNKLVAESALIRSSICRTASRTEDDFWLKVTATLRTCRGLSGLHEEMENDLDGGKAYCSTMALSVIADLVALRSKLVF